jgi:AcrR family transcriptional regulator
MPSVARVLRTAGPRPSRRERRRVETRERIFRAALQLFAQRGFIQTTVEHITEAADVGKGTFFNYFPSKEHVFGVMTEIQLGKIGEGVEEAEAGSSSIERVVERLFHRLAEEPGKSPALARGLMSALVGSDRVRQLAGEAMAEGRKRLTRIFSLGQKHGEIRRDRKPQSMAWMFQQTLFGTIVLWTIQPETPLTPRIDQSFEHFWAAIASRGSR